MPDLPKRRLVKSNDQCRRAVRRWLLGVSPTLRYRGDNRTSHVRHGKGRRNFSDGRASRGGTCTAHSVSLAAAEEYLHMLDETPDTPLAPTPRSGAQSRTMTRDACAPDYDGLTDAERVAGHTFITPGPTAFVVARVASDRAMRLMPEEYERHRRHQWVPTEVEGMP